jgi:hypothetical protein
LKISELSLLPDFGTEVVNLADFAEFLFHFESEVDEFSGANIEHPAMNFGEAGFVPGPLHMVGFDEIDALLPHVQFHQTIEAGFTFGDGVEFLPVQFFPSISSFPLDVLASSNKVVEWHTAAAGFPDS